MGKMAWSDELRHWRRAMKLTQEEAAKLLGITYHAITKYEQGRRVPHALAVPELRRRMEDAKA